MEQNFDPTYPKNKKITYLYMQRKIFGMIHTQPLTVITYLRNRTRRGKRELSYFILIIFCLNNKHVYSLLVLNGTGHFVVSTRPQEVVSPGLDDVFMSKSPKGVKQHMVHWT